MTIEPPLKFNSKTGIATESLEVGFELRLSLLILDLECHVMNGALAEGPTALRQIGRMLDLHDFSGSAVSDVEVNLPAFAPGVPEAHRVGHEGRHLLRVAHGHSDSIHAADRQVLRQVRSGPRTANIFADSDQLVFDTAWMMKDEPFRSEAFDRSAGDMMLREASLPVFESGRGHGKAYSLDLAGAAASHPAVLLHWETGYQRALIAHAVAVVKMIEGDFPVVQERLFDAAQAKSLDVKVVIFLCAADTQSQMVMAPDGRFHRLLLSLSSHAA